MFHAAPPEAALTSRHDLASIFVVANCVTHRGVTDKTLNLALAAAYPRLKPPFGNANVTAYVKIRITMY